MKRIFWLVVGILGIVFLVNSCVKSLSDYGEEYIADYYEQ